MPEHFVVLIVEGTKHVRFWDPVTAVRTLQLVHAARTAPDRESSTSAVKVYSVIEASATWLMTDCTLQCECLDMLCSYNCLSTLQSSTRENKLI